MLNFLIVLLPSFLVIAFKWYYYKDRGNKWQSRGRSVGTIDPQELMYSLLAAIVIAALSLIVFVASVNFKAADTQILNTEVKSKKSYMVSCSHMEDCNCRTEKDSQGNKYRKCDSCPEHAYDVDWTVHTPLGSFDIDRISRRGLEEPPRFKAVRIGEPAALSDSYRNWLLLDESSLLMYQATVNPQYAMPNYPTVYDYYRYNRVINYSKANTAWVNDYLNEWLKKKGSTKQLNIVTVFVEYPEDYFYQLMTHWRGGKKNDLILVFGMKDNKIVWQQSQTYAKGMNNRHLIEELKMATLNKEWSKELLDEMLLITEAKFNRIEASQFADNAKFIQPPLWLYILVIVLNMISSFVISRHFVRN